MLGDKTFPGYWRKMGFAWGAATKYWQGMTEEIVKAGIWTALLIFTLVKFDINFITICVCIVFAMFAAKHLAAYKDYWHSFYEVEHNSSIVFGPDWSKMGTEKEWTEHGEYD